MTNTVQVNFRVCPFNKGRKPKHILRSYKTRFEDSQIVEKKFCFPIRLLGQSSMSARTYLKQVSGLLMSDCYV